MTLAASYERPSRDFLAALFLSVDGCSKNTMSPGRLIPAPLGKAFPELKSPASESLGAFVGFFMVGFARIAARVVHASLVPFVVSP